MIERVIDPSLFVDIRERLCGEEFDKFNKLVIGKSEMLKPHQAFVKRKSKPGKENGSNTDAGSTNRGTLKIDATITDQELKFPTDVDLLNTSRENLDRIIDLLYIFGCDDVILRTYKRIARKKYLRFSIKRRKVNKEIRRVVKT